jgi:hypothetical protein
VSAKSDFSHFGTHRTREELNQLLRYGHVIPVSKGLTAKYVAEHYPGWTWNSLVEVFKAAGIFEGRGGSPPKCDDRVATLHFNSKSSLAVEWSDGTSFEIEPERGTQP